MKCYTDGEFQGAEVIIVLMGVTGSGKTTIGALLAARLGVAFADADDYHPPANKEKMRAGQPLDDRDRAPWLAALNGVMRGWNASGLGGILACSALKEKYRDALRSGMPEGAVRFVMLDGTRELIAARLAQRRHEYMNPILLDSQFAAMELPEDALVIANDRTPGETVDIILRHMD